jgi:hypothetical protein
MLLLLTALGLFSGMLAGLLGIGGGTVLVPILVSLGYSPLQAVATSSFTIVITSVSGSLQNWRMGVIDLRSVLALGMPALITAQLGVIIANRLSARLLLIAFGVLLMLNIYLMGLKQRLTHKAVESDLTRPGGTTPENHPASQVGLLAKYTLTGGLAGVLAGVFGIGGGIILVPLQILLLNASIKQAIQTSLAVIVMTAMSATLGHALSHNVLWQPGILLGLGGLLGAQLSTRFLPKLPDRLVNYLFRGMLVLLAVYIFTQAFHLSAG